MVSGVCGAEGTPGGCAEGVGPTPYCSALAPYTGCWTTPATPDAKSGSRSPLRSDEENLHKLKTIQNTQHQEQLDGKEQLLDNHRDYRGTLEAYPLWGDFTLRQKTAVSEFFTHIESTSLLKMRHVRRSYLAA
ncbi:hypothetical protein BIW11_03119 [Tropilaelaps mercedesae]|uniref:Uncharacterized protein n=1 Tax=Tropilaelaps mercedesae TaxID=418985 RepID=A0A1V9XRU9_9ACAR|nr:hypothetical protein BIW11_03119 [Tropilaelaps mercedesae]